MIEPLNYCRQIMILARNRAEATLVSRAEREQSLRLMDLCAASQKFLLPYGGHILDDRELRALDDSFPLRLPHTFIALEFLEHLEGDGQRVQAKRVVFAREDKDDIFILPFAWLPQHGEWATAPTLRLPKTGYLDRSVKGETGFFAACVGGAETRDQVKHNDVSVLLSFCNALQCSNVGTERIEPRRPGKKAKNGLPFDTYHVLTIDVARRGSGSNGTAGGTHRSPREHLRRGHIVRPEGRRPYWRNATVVNAGKCAGRIEKDYRVRSGTVPSDEA